MITISFYTTLDLLPDQKSVAALQLPRKPAVSMARHRRGPHDIPCLIALFAPVRPNMTARYLLQYAHRP